MLKHRDQRIELQEQREDDLERFTHVGDIIIPGLEAKHRSYTQATASVVGEDPPPEEVQTLEVQVAADF